MAASSNPSRAAAAGGALRRLATAWRGLEREQRTAAVAAMALFATMFLPWYRVTGLLLGKNGQGVTVHDSHSAIQTFTFVEASVLLVALAVLWLLFARGEGKAFHLPFGDGNVIFAGGLWVCALVFWRFFDKPSLAVGKSAAGTVDLSWGIFVTFLTGLFLAFSGQRLRAAHLAEPPLPGDVAPSDAPLPPGRRGPAAAAAVPRDDRPRPARDASATVVDRRDPSLSETLVADVPEYPRPAADEQPAGPPPEPPTGPTRVARPEDQLTLEGERLADPDGQLRFDRD